MPQNAVPVVSHGSVTSSRWPAVYVASIFYFLFIYLAEMSFFILFYVPALPVPVPFLAPFSKGTLQTCAHAQGQEGGKKKPFPLAVRTPPPKVNNLSRQL